MRGHGSKLTIIGGSFGSPIDRFIKSIEVGGESILDLTYGYSKIFISDLIIGNGAFLAIKAALLDQGDGLFVKKSSRYLEDALRKIRFSGMDGEVGVRDYNKDYWELGVGIGFGAIPEPATYGAVFSLSALGFVAWRRRARGAISLSKWR